MGRKTNPNILRVGNITHAWDGHWFADKKPEFRTKLQEDLRIRGYFEKEFRHASISRLEISRQPRETVLTIHTSRPAVVIGRGGSGIEKIQKDLAKKIKIPGRIRIDVQEVRNPDTDATAVATQVVDQIERRMPFRRILKGSIQRIMQAGARGARISVSGRLNGAEIARTEWLAEGNVPLHTFRSDVSYSYRVAFTTFGTIGVKVWINRGDLLDKKKEEAGQAPAVQKKVTTPKKRRRTSLAEKAKSTKQMRKN